MLILLTDGSVVEMAGAVDAVQSAGELSFLSEAREVLATLEVAKVLAYTFNPRVSATMKKDALHRSLDEARSMPVTKADPAARSWL